MKSRRSLLILSPLVLALMSSFGWSQEAKTVPVGVVTLNIAAGNGAVRNATVLSFPLKENPQITGKVIGTITGVSSTTLTDSSAGWGTISSSSSPVFIRITSGAAQGRTFRVVSNNSTTITVASSDGASSTPVNLSNLGVATGAGYELIQGDTILSVFGQGNSNGVNAPLGNANRNFADTIQINVNNSWRLFYYDLAQNSWINFTDEVPGNDFVIPPDSAVIYNRLAASQLSITVLGVVPSQDRRVVVRDGQTTMISSFWPVPTTLSSLNLQSLPGWVSNVNPSLADIVQMRIGSSWFSFYHDGTQWMNYTDEIPANNQQVSVGTGLLIKRKATASGGSVLSQPVPYTL